MSDKDIELDLFENAKDFIAKGLQELLGNEIDFREISELEATQFSSTNYKYGINNLFSGFLLLLKERLSRHMPELIFKGKIADVKAKLRTKNSAPNTVDLDEALERLEIGPRVSFTDAEINAIRKIQDYRNRFEHYKFSGNKYQILADLVHFIEILSDFSKKQLNFDLQHGPQKIEAVDYTLVKVKEQLLKFESEIEETVHATLSQNVGRSIPKSILGTIEDLTIPPLLDGRVAYKLNEKYTYTPDFESSGDGKKLLIEVKGAFALWNSRFQELLELLLQPNVNFNFWLVVNGEFPDDTKAELRAKGAIVTDYFDWQLIQDFLSQSDTNA